MTYYHDLPVPCDLRPTMDRVLAAVADGRSLAAIARAEGYAVNPDGVTSLSHWRRYPEWRRRVAEARQVARRRWRPAFLEAVRSGATIQSAARKARVGLATVERARRTEPAFAAQLAAAMARHPMAGRAVPEHDFEAVLTAVRMGESLASACAAIGRATFGLNKWRQASPGSRSHRRAQQVDQARAQARARRRA